MKILRILGRIGVGLFVVWGLVALFHTAGRQPGQRPFLFWLVLPYPVLIALTVVIISACARNNRSGSGEAGFSWFAVMLGAAASIGLAVAISTGLFSIISWAYVGHVSLTSTAPTDSAYVAINIAVFVACYVWAGAISAALSPSRPLAHALSAGVVLLLWSCVLTLLVNPLVMSQLLVALLLPIPLAVGGSLAAAGPSSSGVPSNPSGGMSA